MKLTPASSLDIVVLVDNELDPISHYNHVTESVGAYGNLVDIGLTGRIVKDRGTGHPAPPGPFPPMFLPPDGNVVGQDEPVPIRELSMQQICCSGHGLSLLITARKGDVKKTILFDTGPDEDLWESNVKKLKPDLSDVEVIVLSHWHRDHSGGLLRAIKLINSARQEAGKKTPVQVDLHPERPDFRGFQLPTSLISLEADPTFEEVQQAGATLVTSAESHTVLDDFFFVSGEIPRKTAYEQGIRSGMRFSKTTGKWTPDPLITDERFLMCLVEGETRKGAMVFTGCGHAGIVNTCLNAAEILENQPLYGVFGGFHLADADEQKLNATVKDLKAHVGDAIFFPGHCTGWRAQDALEALFPGQVAPSKVGMKFTIRN